MGLEMNTFSFGWALNVTIGRFLYIQMKTIAVITIQKKNAIKAEFSE